AMWIMNLSEVKLNDNIVNVKSLLGKDYNNLSEIVTELKNKIFDECFNNEFPEHPKYSEILSSTNINNAISIIAEELCSGNFRTLYQRSKNFLNTLNLLNENGDPDVASNKVTQ